MVRPEAVASEDDFGENDVTLSLIWVMCFGMRVFNGCRVTNFDSSPAPTKVLDLYEKHNFETIPWSLPSRLIGISDLVQKLLFWCMLT